LAITTLSLRLTPRPTSLQQLAIVAEPMLRESYADSEFVFAVLTAVHEIASNIMEHARPRSYVEVTFTLSGSEITVAMVDDGAPFDASVLDSRDEGQGFADAVARGRGLQMTRALVDMVTYERQSDINCWRIRKQIAA